MSKSLDEMLQEAPVLTFEPFEEKEELTPVQPEPIMEEVPQVILTPAEQKMVDEFAAQIDITNAGQVLQFGAGSQKKIADFSETALNSVRTKEFLLI